MVELARKRQARFNDRIEFCVADVTKYEDMMSLKRNKHFTKAVSNMAIMDISDIEEIQLYGDIKWLAEALSNVVKNCIESTPDGGQVKISAEENAMYVKLCVIDSGTGIAEEDIPHLFERFYRGKNSGKNGAGIGLALAKAIITQQNGRIIAENIMPCGAKFTIFFDRGVA